MTVHKQSTYVLHNDMWKWKTSHRKTHSQIFSKI